MPFKIISALLIVGLLIAFLQYRNHTNAALVQLDKNLYQQTSLFETDPNVDWREERTRKGIPQRSEDLFSQSWADYAAGDTTKAITFLTNIMEGRAQDIAAQARLNVAFMQYQFENYQAAAKNANGLRQSHLKEVRHKAQWLLVNIYLQTDEEEQLNDLLKIIINEPNHSFSASALALQADLQSFWRFSS